jgi:hypothetical protein
MWLPTFVGMNTALIKEIDEAISPALVGQSLTEDLLDRAHAIVLDFLTEKFPQCTGLFDYLEGVKYVESNGGKEGG